MELGNSALISLDRKKQIKEAKEYCYSIERKMRLVEKLKADAKIKFLKRNEHIHLAEAFNFFLRDMPFMLIVAKLKGFNRLLLGGNYYATLQEREDKNFFQFPSLIKALDNDIYNVMPIRSNFYLF